MAKKVVKKLNPDAMRVTVYFGYALFVIAAVLLVVSILPWFNLAEPSSFNTDALVFVIAFVLAALAPAIVGYFIGDRASTSKSPLIHHYSGVLFGILGFWLATVLSTLSGVLGWFGFVNSMPLHSLTTVLPATAAIIILIALGALYAKRTKHQVMLDDYLPFRALLISSFLALFLVTGIIATIDSFNSIDVWGSFAVFVLPSVFMVLLVGLGAWMLGCASGTAGERTTRSLVATSYVVVAITFVGQIIFMIDGNNQHVGSIAFGVGALLWFGYILLLRRASKPKKQLKRA